MDKIKESRLVILVRLTKLIIDSICFSKKFTMLSILLNVTQLMKRLLHFSMQIRLHLMLLLVILTKK